MSVTKRTLQGEALVASNGDTPTSAVQIPAVPSDGAFSFSGTLIAVDAAAAPSTRFSVTYFIQWAGTSQGGDITRNVYSAVSTLPGDGGSAQGFAPGNLLGVLGDLGFTLALPGISGKTVKWAWSIDVVQTDLVVP